MNSVVVDTSALASLLFWEPGAERIASLLRDADLLAPTLLPYEIASVAVGKLRSGEDGEATALGLGLFGSMGIDLLPVDPDHAAALAQETDLTAYDAAYLWLALEQGADLVTLDEGLARAWSQLRS